MIKMLVSSFLLVGFCREFILGSSLSYKEWPAPVILGESWWTWRRLQHACFGNAHVWENEHQQCILFVNAKSQEDFSDQEPWIQLLMYGLVGWLSACCSKKTLLSKLLPALLLAPFCAGTVFFLVYGFLCFQHWRYQFVVGFFISSTMKTWLALDTTSWWVPFTGCISCCTYVLLPSNAVRVSQQFLEVQIQW